LGLYWFVLSEQKRKNSRSVLSFCEGRTGEDKPKMGCRTGKLLRAHSYGSIRQSLLVLGNIPFALIGGIFALWVSGEYLSVPASVGFIVLLGVPLLFASGPGSEIQRPLVIVVIGIG